MGKKKEPKMIYQTWDLLSDEEQEQYVYDIKLVNEGITDEVAREWAAEDVNNEHFLWLLCEMKRFEGEYVITGTLGLWWGHPEIEETEPMELHECVRHCAEGMNDFSVYEINGDLYVDAHHHDGTNHFCIKKIGYNNRRVKVHYGREVHGWKD